MMRGVTPNGVPFVAKTAAGYVTHPVTGIHTNADVTAAEQWIREHFKGVTFSVEWSPRYSYDVNPRAVHPGLSGRHLEIADRIAALNR